MLKHRGSRRPGRATALACAGITTAWASLAAGCAGGYTVEARNDSNRAAVVTIERDVVADDDEVLASSRLAPGAWVELGSFNVAGFDPVYARVGLPNDPGLPRQKLRLERGRTLIVIDAAGDRAAWSGIHARTERPQD